LILSKSDGARPLNPCHLKIKLTLSHLSRSNGIRLLLQNLCERFKNEDTKYLFHETLALEQIADFLRKDYRWTMTLPSQMTCKYSRMRGKKNLCYSNVQFRRNLNARSSERRISIIASNCFIILAAGANNRRCFSVCRFVASLYKQFILLILTFFLYHSETKSLKAKRIQQPPMQRLREKRFVYLNMFLFF